MAASVWDMVERPLAASTQRAVRRVQNEAAFAKDMVVVVDVPTRAAQVARSALPPFAAITVDAGGAPMRAVVQPQPAPPICA